MLCKIVTAQQEANKEQQQQPASESAEANAPATLTSTTDRQEQEHEPKIFQSYSTNSWNQEAKKFKKGASSLYEIF